MPTRCSVRPPQIVLLRDFHLSDDDAVRHAISRSNIVINLIGSRMQTRNFTFDQVSSEHGVSGNQGAVHLHTSDACPLLMLPCKPACL